MHSLQIARARFEAARQLDAAAEQRFARRHGHSFQLSLACDSRLEEASGLSDSLAALHQQLDYQDLNTLLDTPDDLALAQWIANRLPVPVDLCLSGAPEYGVQLAEDGSARVWFDTHFEAAHQLPHVPPGHKCGRLHGHGFGIRLVADAQRTSAAQLAEAWLPLHQRLNHHYLNDIPGLENPTSEVMAHWLYQQLASRIDGLAWVEVRETHSAGSQYDGRTFRIWKEQHFESAVPFDSNGRYTGHSYLVRLMLQGSLDQTMGWLLDFGDVKGRFTPLYKQLDHNPLDKLIGIRTADNAGVAEWIHSHLIQQVPELARIDLFESAWRGVSLGFRDGVRWPQW